MTNATGKLSPSVAKLILLQAVYMDSHLTSTDKTVFAALMTFHNGLTGQLNPSVTTIAKRASLCRRTVIQRMPALVQAGYVTVTQHPLKRGYNEVNTYRLAGVYAVNESTTAVIGQAKQSPDKPASPAEIGRIMRGEETAAKPATAAEISRIMRGVETADTCGQVVHQMHHPSAPDAPPPSAPDAPKLTEPFEQSERTVALSNSAGGANAECGVTEDTSGTTEANSNDGATVENIRLEAQAQPQQATSRDVACLQGVEGGQAQAERQHLESRDGAEKELKADDFAKLRRKIVPWDTQAMCRPSPPRRIRRKGHSNGGSSDAW